MQECVAALRKMQFSSEEECERWQVVMDSGLMSSEESEVDTMA